MKWSSFCEHAVFAPDPQLPPRMNQSRDPLFFPQADLPRRLLYPLSIQPIPRNMAGHAKPHEFGVKYPTLRFYDGRNLSNRQGIDPVKVANPGIQPDAVMKRSLCSGPACIFPLSFGWQGKRTVFRNILPIGNLKRRRRQNSSASAWETESSEDFLCLSRPIHFRSPFCIVPA